MVKFTTIAISEDTKGELDKLKVHPNQSYDEVISNILKQKKRVDKNGL